MFVVAQGVFLMGSAETHTRSLESFASLGSCLLFEMFSSLDNDYLRNISSLDTKYFVQVSIGVVFLFNGRDIFLEHFSF